MYLPFPLKKHSRNIHRISSFKSIVAVILFSMASQMAEAQSWITLEVIGDMQARQANAFMACKGKFYLIGGRGLQPVDIFDPSTGQWHKGAGPPVEMHHFQAVRYGEEIWVMGAFTGSFPNEKPLEHIYIYDTAEDRWRRGDPIPGDRLRGSAGIAVYRGMFYMIGGTRDRYKRSGTSWVDRYDPKTGKWKQLNDAPRARDHFHAGICNGKIYVTGGRNTFLNQRKESERTIAEVDVFNIETGRWKTLPESQNLPTQRAGCTTVVIMDHILVIGGESMAQEEAFDVVEAYDVEREVWEQWDNLSQGRHGTQAFMCVGSVFITSGSGSRDGGTTLTSIERLTF